MAAGSLRGHAGVMVGLALALVMVPPPAAAAAAAAEGACHHVVGGKRGWDIGSGIAEWSLGKVFRVGDSIWFKYSAAGESVVELGSLEALEACDLSNPIRTYTQGVNQVALDGEGSRYFAGGGKESCQCGLKLHVAVLPAQPETAEKAFAGVVPRSEKAAAAPADGPSACGSTSHAVSGLLCVGMALLRAARRCLRSASRSLIRPGFRGASSFTYICHSN